MSMKKVIYAIVVVIMFSSCATNKNTSTIRWWKGFNSRYNTFFNGKQAYKNGYKSKTEGNRDNCTDYIPLLLVGNKSSQNIGKGDFQTAITKCEKTIKLHSIKKKPEYKRGHKLTPKEKAYKERKEYNPFIHNAWLLMGNSQFQTGEFLEAASTYAYIERLYDKQPEIRDRARSMMALCYTELGWYYDAEELLRQVRRDSIPYQCKNEYNRAMANFYLRQKRWEEALPYLDKEINTLHGTLKARACFLKGQICKTLGRKEEAYKALQKCLKQSPPYELKFNAQILQTEVMPKGNNAKKLKKLKRMSKQGINENFKDQIIYAIGNVYMTIPDTAKAIEAYESGLGVKKPSALAQAAINLKLGDIYWEKERFGKAHQHYSKAIGTLDKEHERYEELKDKTKILDKLAPPADEVFLQDSLQAMVRMPEEERLAIIDRYIAEEKARQKAARADSLARKNSAGGGNNGGDNPLNNQQEKKKSSNIANANDGADWYFYSYEAVSQGKDLFRKIWGNRNNEDNWRRSNKELAQLDKIEEIDYEKQDSIDAAMADSLANDTVVVDESKDDKGGKKKKEIDEKLTREYYLNQLPFTEEAMNESNAKLMKGLYEAGVVEKDLMNNYLLTKKTLGRLYTEYPEYESREDLLYQLFLTELRWGTEADSEKYKQELQDQFPEGKYTKIISAPDFVENALYGKHLEDSLYANTYEAYLANDYVTMARNCKVSETKYPEGENRAKFMFLEAMTKLKANDLQGFVDELKEVTSNYSSDKISDIAGAMIHGIQEGKVPVGGNFDLSSLILDRTNQTDSINGALKKDTLSAEKFTDFTILICYNADSLNEGKLIYELSRFNFSKFTIRKFDMQVLKAGTESRVQINGFNNFDEAHHYKQELYSDSLFRPYADYVDAIIISNQNLELIGIKYTLPQYKQFYRYNFAPSKIKKDLQMDKPDGSKFIWDEFEEDGKDDEDEEYEDIDSDDGEWY